jgi:hypothetical protein
MNMSLYDVEPRLDGILVNVAWMWALVMETAEVFLGWEEVLVVVPSFLRRCRQPHLLAVLYHYTYNSGRTCAYQYACDDFLAAVPSFSMQCLGGKYRTLKACASW